MKKFLVLYLAPAQTMEEWMKLPPERRKADEEKMQNEWREWMSAHRDALAGMTAGTGKTKKITAGGVSDIKNDIMLCSMIEAESHEAAATLFEGHPHFGIPGASIEVMPINPLPGMGMMQ